MRVLVTNDDGVNAPGLGALVRALSAWKDEGGDTTKRTVIVVAPLANFSGASAAVGTVYERSAVAYQRFHLDGAQNIPTYGVDGSPALSVLVGVLGGFGPPPDLIVSGINLGVNVGRSILHSGTVGAVLTGAQMGISGLAVSLRSGSPPEPWESASTLAVRTLEALSHAPKGSVLNLNVPSLPLAEIRGVRNANISKVDVVREADLGESDPQGGPHRGGDPDSGLVRLRLGAAVPSLGTLEGVETDDDAALIAKGYATLTALLGVHQNTTPNATALVTHSLDALNSVVGESS